MRSPTSPACVHLSVMRLLAAEADKLGFTCARDRVAMDALEEAIGGMTHDQRLARLVDLGKPVDDLELPEPAR